MLVRWITARLARSPSVRAGGETFRKAQPDRFGCLLIHGWAGSPSEMRPVGEYLAGHGIDVLGVRLAGHGTSLWDLHQYTHHDWIDSASRALTGYLKEKDNVIICGFSMGGVIALRLAAEFAGDPRIAGIVTLATPLRFRQGPEARRAFVRRIWRRLLEGRPHATNPESTKSLVNYNIVSPRSVIELMRLISGTVPRLGEIHQPILVVQSFGDQTVPAFNAELIYNEVGSAEKSIVWLNESGHMITVDHDADTVAEAVGRFVFDRRNRVTERVSWPTPELAATPTSIVP